MTTNKPDVLTAAKEAARRGYGPLRAAGFEMGADAYFRGVKIGDKPSLRTFAWRNKGAEWTRLALQEYRNNTAPEKAA